MTTLTHATSSRALDRAARRTLSRIADHLIPAAHGMPSAAEIVNDERLRFVLDARADLLAPLHAALRPELGDDAAARLEALGRDEPVVLGVLQLVIVGAYYTDRRVRELIGYPGQIAIEVRSWEYPAYLDEGLIDALMARGPTWRDPATGRRATAEHAPRTYAERWSAVTVEANAALPAGGDHGRDEHS